MYKSIPFITDGSECRVETAELSALFITFENVFKALKQLFLLFLILCIELLQCLLTLLIVFAEGREQPLKAKLLHFKGLLLRLIIGIKAFATTNELNTDTIDELRLWEFVLLQKYSQVVDKLLWAHCLIGWSLVGGCSRILCCGGIKVKLCLVWSLRKFHSHSLLHCDATSSLPYQLRCEEALSEIRYGL